MSTLRSAHVTAGLAVVLAFCTCCAPRKAAPVRSWEPATAGLYKVRLRGGPGEKARRFRLMLFAALPDRLHGEVVSPLGHTQLVADAGGGRISVLFVRDRLAFAGAADAGVIHDLLGVPLELEDLVGALLTGELANEAVTVERLPADAVGLPEKLRISAPPRVLSLELRRWQELRADPASLGRGKPPPGVEIRPLGELDPDALPGEETVSEEPS